MKMFSLVAGISARIVWRMRHRNAFGGRSTLELPRLLVDVSAIVRHDAQTGVQRVVRAVWSELLRRDGSDFWLVPVYATHDHGYCYAPTEIFNSLSSKDRPEPVKACCGDKFLGLDLSAHYLPKYRSQIRAWRNHGATVHLVVYDLLPIVRPDWFTKKTGANFRKWFEVLANDADQAICISKQVSRDLRDQLHATRGKSCLSIINMRMGGDIVASRPTSGISLDVSNLLGRLRFRPAILMVGTVEPRKGYEVAMAAFEHLWRTRRDEAPDLVIVGKSGWKTSKLQSYIRTHPEHGTRLHWLDSVSDEGLCRLYDACRGLFMASRGEGFGLPLVEAVTQRLRVLARDLPVFREQSMPNVIYFDDDDPHLLGTQLMELTALGSTRPASTPRLPTWSESVDRLLADIGISSKLPTHLKPATGAPL